MICETSYGLWARQVLVLGVVQLVFTEVFFVWEVSTLQKDSTCSEASLPSSSGLLWPWLSEFVRCISWTRGPNSESASWSWLQHSYFLPIHEFLPAASITLYCSCFVNFSVRTLLERLISSFAQTVLRSLCGSCACHVLHLYNTHKILSGSHDVDTLISCANHYGTSNLFPISRWFPVLHVIWSFTHLQL